MSKNNQSLKMEFVKETISKPENAVIIDEVKPHPMDNLNSRLASALSIDKDSFYEKIDNPDGTTLEVSKKTYNFVNPIGKRASMTVYDSSIIESMEKIGHALYGKTILTYAICKEFSKIAESGKLENMGFKTIAEFGKAVYGLETSTVNHYARIGSTFINDDYTVKTGLPELSVSHFIELSSTVQDGDISPIIELYANGTLVDGMSTKKMRETLKSLNNPSLVDKSEPGNTETDKSEPKQENENTAETVPSDTEITELEAEFDSQVVVGKILNACTAIEQMFTMLNNHEVKAVGYDEHMDAIKAIAKALL
jgi:hypothetical protein